MHLDARRGFVRDHEVLQSFEDLEFSQHPAAPGRLKASLDASPLPSINPQLPSINPQPERTASGNLQTAGFRAELKPSGIIPVAHRQPADGLQVPSLFEFAGIPQEVNRPPSNPPVWLTGIIEFDENPDGSAVEEMPHHSPFSASPIGR